MDNFALVRPEHLNHHGRLFGGALLKWVDEFAWMAATRDFPHCCLVTIGLDRVEFRRPVPCGAILRFSILPHRQGTTSIAYTVEVFSDEPGADDEAHVFSTHVTFVHVGPDGEKRPLPSKDRLRSAM
jgi:acyl-CoA hydrolase